MHLQIVYISKVSVAKCMYEFKSPYGEGQLFLVAVFFFLDKNNQCAVWPMNNIYLANAICTC